jgi:hypothetical protein
MIFAWATKGFREIMVAFAIDEKTVNILFTKSAIAINLLNPSTSI